MILNIKERWEDGCKNNRRTCNSLWLMFLIRGNEEIVEKHLENVCVLRVDKYIDLTKNGND